MIFLFWISAIIVFYTFIGYGMLLYIIIRAKRLFSKSVALIPSTAELPSVTLIVAAFNEEKFIVEKIKNTLALKYPYQKLNFLFVTDGSTDSSPDIISKFPQIMLMHQAERQGKINAIHRAMQVVKSDVTVFTDANTLLNRDSLVNIARHYSDAMVGAVAGEKRVQVTNVSDATAGEGFYWKLESTIKKLDSELYSVVGAAGELFSIRTKLYEPVPQDTILDDFMISLKIASKGFRIIYEPEAFATETASANTTEEFKRKTRIAAGGIQSIIRLKHLLNPLKQPLLTFQYISHRVLRWTITPFLIISTFFLNIYIVAMTASAYYTAILILQSFVYLMALAGWLFQRKEVKVKLLFIPYYFCLMNYAVIVGIGRFLFKGQPAAWEKTARK